VQQGWQELPARFAAVELDAFVVMPNHIHAILVFSPPDGGAVAPLGAVVRGFKSLTAVRVNRLLGRSGEPLWQRDYYDRIVRDDAELDRIRTYIVNNPLQWSLDTENPANWDRR
jgi:REP element-mobilizing transposase RayT